MARKSKLPLSLWPTRRKVFTLTALVAVAAATLTLANYAMNKYYSFKSEAAVGHAKLFFEQNAVTVTPKGLGLNVWTTTDASFSTAVVTYTFNHQITKLSGDVTFPGTPFLYTKNITSFKDANITGQGSFILSMEPIKTGADRTPIPTDNPPQKGVVTTGPVATASGYPQSSTPATPPYASSVAIPTLAAGTYKLATIPLVAVSAAPAKSIVDFKLINSQITGGDTIGFALTSTPATLYHNSSPPPSPSPKSSPLPPTASTPPVRVSPTPYCSQQLGSWRYREQCSTSPLSYRYLEYQCQGEVEYHTIGGSTSCKPESTLLTEAKLACTQRVCASPPPLPSPSVSPVTVSLKGWIDKPPGATVYLVTDANTRYKLANGESRLGSWLNQFAIFRSSPSHQATITGQLKEIPGSDSELVVSKIMRESWEIVQVNGELKNDTTKKIYTLTLSDGTQYDLGKNYPPQSKFTRYLNQSVTVSGRLIVRYATIPKLDYPQVIR